MKMVDTLTDRLLHAVEQQKQGSTCTIRLSSQVILNVQYIVELHVGLWLWMKQRLLATFFSCSLSAG